ncbi:hypothetical protein SODALDRAFT_265009, partial [Sodiomyces alkalinus F11]
ASNANLASLFPSDVSGTGGNWKKSPVMTSCIPPHGLPLFLMVLPICDSLSNRSPSTMETSSMIKTLV